MFTLKPTSALESMGVDDVTKGVETALTNLLRLHVVRYLDAEARRCCRAVSKEIRDAIDEHHYSITLTPSIIKQLLQRQRSFFRPCFLAFHDCSDEHLATVFAASIAEKTQTVHLEAHEASEVTWRALLGCAEPLKSLTLTSCDIGDVHKLNALTCLTQLSLCMCDVHGWQALPPSLLNLTLRSLSGESFQPSMFTPLTQLTRLHIGRMDGQMVQSWAGTSTGTGTSTSTTTTPTVQAPSGAGGTSHADCLPAIPAMRALHALRGLRTFSLHNSWSAGGSSGEATAAAVVLSGLVCVLPSWPHLQSLSLPRFNLQLAPTLVAALSHLTALTHLSCESLSVAPPLPPAPRLYLPNKVHLPSLALLEVCTLDSAAAATLDAPRLQALRPAAAQAAGQPASLLAVTMGSRQDIHRHLADARGVLGAARHLTVAYVEGGQGRAQVRASAQVSEHICSALGVWHPSQLGITEGDSSAGGGGGGGEGCCGWAPAVATPASRCTCAGVSHTPGQGHRLQLRYLTLTPAAVRHLVAGPCAHVTHLSLRDCHIATPTHPSPAACALGLLAVAIPCLESLALHLCTGLTCQHVVAMVQARAAGHIGLEARQGQAPTPQSPPPMQQQEQQQQQQPTYCAAIVEPTHTSGSVAGGGGQGLLQVAVTGCGGGMEAGVQRMLSAAGVGALLQQACMSLCFDG